MKKTILITDVVQEIELEKKLLPQFNLIFKNIEKVTHNEFKIINGILTGHSINFDQKTLSKFPNCKAIVRYGAGYNNINIEVAKKKGIRVFNVPEYGSNEVADFAISLSMSFLKNLNSFYFNILNKKKSNYWKYDSGHIYKRLSTVNVGVIGLGRIGKSYAKKMLSLGPKIFFYDPFIKKYNKKLKKLSSLEEIFKVCDLVSLHVPSTKKTRFFITNTLLKHAKKKIIIINTARGDLIRENTVINGLKSGKILCYGTDVLEKEPINFGSKFFKLIKNPKFESRVILTPHSAFYTKESYHDLRYNTAKTIYNYFKKNSLKNCVNK